MTAAERAHDARESDRCVLESAIAAVRRRLENAAHGRPTGPETSPEPPPGSSLARVAATFALSAFERDVLVLAAAVALDADVARLCDTPEDNAARGATFGLALAILARPHWSAITPAGPLRWWRLIDLAAPGLTQGAVTIDECVLNFLLGAPHLDSRLAGRIRILPDQPHPTPSQFPASEQLRVAWARGRPAQLCGPDDAGALGVAAHAAAARDLGLALLEAADIPEAVGERDLFARLWNRQAALDGFALAIACEGGEPQRLGAFVRRVQGPVVLLRDDPAPPGGGRLVPIDLARPTAEEQAASWRAAAPALDAHDVARLTAQFDVGVETIRATAATAQAGEALWNACRRQVRGRIEGLAERIDPAADWDDLILPPRTIETLRAIAAQVGARATVLRGWGYGARYRRGLGVAALFAGVSGTGKTLAAEVLAASLALDLYRIDLSAVVSKYIGETEKNLSRIFDAAEAGAAVLLFDEADALFGKRSEVRDSHDRYANIEVSYLLQRMEAFGGLAILTTNMRDALDRAFLRRLAFTVDFPFPDAGERARIWARMIPPEAPTEGLDFARLAQLAVPGGSIRTIALNAAYLAAAAGTPVGMGHMAQAARRECVKLERPLTPLEIEGWA